MRGTYPRLGLLVLAATWLGGCGEKSANEQLIGGECVAAADCDDGDDDTPALECLAGFKGGYCGRHGCAADTDCPAGSICVSLEGETYCFLVCTDKAECNRNRSLDNESNCSSNVDPVGGGTARVCVPPSGV